MIFPIIHNAELVEIVHDLPDIHTLAALFVALYSWYGGGIRVQIKSSGTSPFFQLFFTTFSIVSR